MCVCGIFPGNILRVCVSLPKRVENKTKVRNRKNKQELNGHYTDISVERWFERLEVSVDSTSGRWGNGLWFCLAGVILGKPTCSI